MMIDDNKPDYEFDAYLKADNQSSVLCNVALWLPTDADENLQIEIDSPEERSIVEKFMGKFVSVESEVYLDKPQLSVILSKVWIKQITRQLAMRKLARTRVKLRHVSELNISEKTGNGGEEDGLATVYFQLSNLLYGQPEAWVVPDYLGSRKVEIKKNYTAQSSTGLIFKLEKHYSSYSNISKNKEVVSSQNVISVTGQICVAEIDTIYKETNDFALLLSFAARHQVMVLGYEYWAESKRVRCFKDPLDRYQVKDEEVVEDSLIPIQHFELFVNGALEKWHSIDEKVRLAIKDAIYAIHPFNNSHQSYLDMFSAFEGIINLSKTNVGTEVDNNWDCLQKNLNACIDSQQLSDNANGFLKEGIRNLRKSETFKNKTEYRLNELGVVVNDLWPIFEGVSLYQIRNNLAHGRRMELDTVYLIAQEQLQFLLERFVLVLLGFDYNKSAAGLTIHGIRFRYSKQEISDFQSQLKTNK
jgi:hypothetical protein